MASGKKTQASQRLNEAIAKAIHYHTIEYNMTYPEVIGILEIIKSDVIEDMYIQESGLNDEEIDD